MKIQEETKQRTAGKEAKKLSSEYHNEKKLAVSSVFFHESNNGFVRSRGGKKGKFKDVQDIENK